MAYSKMTAADIRSTVRSITDLDTGDLPDGLLDYYIRDGYYRILDVEKRWPFLEFSFDFTAQQGVRAYALETVASEPMSQIVSVVDNQDTGYRLEMIGYDEAERTYSGVYDTTGEPLFFALWAGSIHIYPKPNSARVLTCRGYREPFDWQTEGGDVDASANLHFALVYYACSRIYQQLEDSAMAEMYKRAFDEAVSLAARNTTTPNSHVPLILSQGKTKHRPTFKGWMESLGRAQWG